MKFECDQSKIEAYLVICLNPSTSRIKFAMKFADFQTTQETRRQPSAELGADFRSRKIQSHKYHQSGMKTDVHVQEAHNESEEEKKMKKKKTSTESLGLWA
jgi:hypothetical protein